MPPSQLKETTMDPDKRMLIRVQVPDPRKEEESHEFEATNSLVERLMGTDPEMRFRYICEHAKFVEDLDI